MSQSTDTYLHKRFLWTWDHSVNWSPASLAGLGRDRGSSGAYPKSKTVFLDDYRRLIDFMQRHTLNGLVIWGFLRDAHGGVDTALELCKYANDRGVGVIPGVGATAYGGIYYEGSHPYNMLTWCAKHPDLAAKNPELRETATCPSKPANREWVRDGITWLFETFPIAGVNIEMGDYGVCQCRECIRNRKQAAYRSAEGHFSLDDVSRFLAPLCQTLTHDWPAKDIIYATYTDFGRAFPATVLQTMPEQAIAQWNISGMITPEAGFPYNRFFSAGEPVNAAPASRNIGYIHHGSQWYLYTREDPVPKSIKRGIDIASQSGMEGALLHGEVAASSIPNRINYLVFSYFSAQPNASWQGFIDDALAGMFPNADLAHTFWGFLTGTAGDVSAYSRFLTKCPDLNQTAWWNWLKKYLQRHRFMQQEFPHHYPGH